MYFKGEDFVYTFNGEPKTKEESEQLIDYDTTVSIDGLSINYFAPKKESKRDINLKLEDLRSYILNDNSIEKDLTDIVYLITAENEEQLIQRFSEAKLKSDNKKTTDKSKIQKDYEQYFDNLCGVAELLKEVDKYQEQNGGILKGVEFPFDLVLAAEDKIKNFALVNLERQSDKESKVFEDWNRKEEQQKEGIGINIMPNGIARGRIFTYAPETVGIKETEGKLDYELDWEFIQQMAERMSQNKGKYEPYNWKKLMDVEKLKQSLFRHTIEIMKGNYADDGRELGHLESLADNAMMINYQLKNNQK